jgi:transcription initiation factor TFIIA large subunit
MAPPPMPSEAEAPRLYRHVVDDVIRRVRSDFVNMGVDEQVLVDLQSLWENRLIEQGIFEPPRQQQSLSPPQFSQPQLTLQHANLPLYHHHHQPPHQNTLHHNQHHQQQQHYSPPNVPAGHPTDAALMLQKLARPAPQQSTNTPAANSIGSLLNNPANRPTNNHQSSPPQIRDVHSADNNDPADDRSSDSDSDEEEPADLVLCQYEKVHRVKARWRCVLRSGALHLSNRDFVFGRATSDFDWS